MFLDLNGQISYPRDVIYECFVNNNFFDLARKRYSNKKRSLKRSLNDALNDDVSDFGYDKRNQAFDDSEDEDKKKKKRMVVKKSG